MTYSLDSSQESECSEDFPTVYGFGHDVLIQSISETLLHNKPQLITFEDGLQTIKLLHAIYRSDELGGWVDVESVGDSDRLGKPDDLLSCLYRTAFSSSPKIILPGTTGQS